MLWPIFVAFSAFEANLVLSIAKQILEQWFSTGVAYHLRVSQVSSRDVAGLGPYARKRMVAAPTPAWHWVFQHTANKCLFPVPQQSLSGCPVFTAMCSDVFACAWTGICVGLHFSTQVVPLLIPQKGGDIGAYSSGCQHANCHKNSLGGRGLACFFRYRPGVEKWQTGRSRAVRVRFCAHQLYVLV